MRVPINSVVHHCFQSGIFTDIHIIVSCFGNFVVYLFACKNRSYDKQVGKYRFDDSE